MARIAIVGGAGFVGTNLAQGLQGSGHEVVIFDVADRLGRLRHSGLQGSVVCEYRNLAVPGAVLSVAADVIVHLAALPQVDYSMLHPESVVVNNVAALMTTLAAARTTATPVLFTSSIEVYGGNNGAQFTESDRPLALSPYAASKIAGEHIVESYRIGFGLDITTVRLTNLYGPWQAPDRIVPRIVLQALLAEQSEAVIGRLRDFLYIEDAIAALTQLIEGNYWGNTFNLAAGNGLDLEKVADAIIETAGSGSYVPVDSPPRDGRGPSLVASGARLSKATGWQPQTDIAEGIRQTVDWYRANRAWWSQFEPLVRATRSTPDFLVDHVLPVTG